MLQYKKICIKKIYFFDSKEKEKYMKKQSFKGILVLASCLFFACFIELVVFNYPGIRTFFEPQKEVEANYYIMDETVTNEQLMQLAEGKIGPEMEKIILKSELESGNNLIFIPNLSFPVSSVHIDYEEPDDSTTVYNLSFTAYGNEFFYYSTEQKVTNSDKEAFLLLDTKTDCYHIKIEVNTNVSHKKVQRIVINRPQFRLIPFRIFLTFVGLLFLYGMITKKIYLFWINQDRSLYWASLFITLLVILFGTWYFYSHIFSDQMEKMVYTEKETHLLDTCNLQVKSILNGNDGNFNIPEYATTPLYDIAEYKQHYYHFTNNLLIYGILLPFRKITGCYLNLAYANLFLLLLTIIAVTLLYHVIVSYFIKKASICNYLLGYLVLLLGSNLLFARRMFSTDLAFLTNFILLLFAILFTFSKITCTHLIVSKILSFLLGLTLGLLLFNTSLGYFYLLLILVLIHFLSKKKERKANRRDILWMILPILLFVFITGKLNQARFGHPFVYGNSYQVQNIDPTYPTSNHFFSMLTGLIETFIITPNINFFQFPFSRMDLTNQTYFLNEFSYEHHVLGLLSFPVIWLLICKRFLVWENKKQKNNTSLPLLVNESTLELNRFLNFMILFSFFVLMIHFLYQGISEIYTLETKFFLTFASVLFVLKYVENDKKCNGTTGIEQVFCFFVILQISIVVPISLSTDQLYLYQVNREFVNTLKNFFLFWI